ncbi:ScbR family autoregulator-binding transcription factor [Streptomyces sp. BE303]|uniref:ScbR family autoregulator-binding transcription factor n=1 Tax=Streptomyces sp. BE303 TaxID=3002528 RepID=UPI002E78E3A6|nr:ScbR family autoregulator-binding transcription factor [Streptomyces sp. BE303]MED7947715.1 ScbR family autoregulator-binding transcription factor [Streptomyces sp. BE303]
MARQERALRTRRLILEAAASVFDESGYEGATIGEVVARAGVTRGAVYFHFASKRELAQGVIEAQYASEAVPERACKLQEFVDTGMVVTHLIPTDPMLSAGVRLSVDQGADGSLGVDAAPGWIARLERLLVAAGERGELLPHVVPADTAALMTASWVGVQLQSQRFTGRADLAVRVATLYRHLMPSIAVPGVLASLDLAADRGARVVAEMAAADPAAAEETATDVAKASEPNSVSGFPVKP